jgi:hypothetical protein
MKHGRERLFTLSLLINNLLLLSYTQAQCAVSMAEAGINIILHQQLCRTPPDARHRRGSVVWTSQDATGGLAHGTDKDAQACPQLQHNDARGSDPAN